MLENTSVHPLEGVYVSGDNKDLISRSCLQDSLGSWAFPRTPNPLPSHSCRGSSLLCCSRAPARRKVGTTEQCLALTMTSIAVIKLSLHWPLQRLSTFFPSLFHTHLVSLPIQLAAADSLLELCPPSHTRAQEAMTAINTWLGTQCRQPAGMVLAQEFNSRLQPYLHV